MENLNFLFKQTGGNISNVDNTFGYPEDAVCKVSSSTEGNYVSFNNKVLSHFNLEQDQGYCTVFGVNPATKQVTFTIVTEENSDNYPVTNVNKLQKGALKKDYIRITSKNAVTTLVDPTVETDEEGNEHEVWDETLFNVNLHTAENGQKYITIGDALTNDNDEAEPEDVFEEVGQEVDDLPFSV
jgi:hypothetical protein